MKVANRFAKTALAAALALGALGAALAAGTSGLNGQYVGDYLLRVRSTNDGVVRGTGVTNYNWVWNFSGSTTGGTVTITNGQVNVAFGGSSGTFAYQLSEVGSSPIVTTLPVFDNGDGTYTIDYAFQVFNPNFNNPKTTTSTTFEITDVAGSLSIVTTDSDNDGVIGENIPQNPFPTNISVELTGNAN